MGFRSTFTTQEYNILWPAWFQEKYPNIHVDESGYGPLHSLSEAKTYLTWRDLPSDIQKAVDWDKGPSDLVLVYLHECGGITRCQISRDSIKWSEPDSWVSVPGVTHSYCYGCADV